MAGRPVTPSAVGSSASLPAGHQSCTRKGPSHHPMGNTTPGMWGGQGARWGVAQRAVTVCRQSPRVPLAAAFSRCVHHGGGGLAPLMSQDVQPAEAPGLHVPSPGRQGARRLPECRGGPWPVALSFPHVCPSQWPVALEGRNPNLLPLTPDTCVQMTNQIGSLSE